MKHFHMKKPSYLRSMADVGRPRLYEKAEDLASECEAYFADCEEKGVRPMISALAYFLGFADKTTLYDYRDREGFSHPIKRAILRVEMAYETRLEGNNVTGSIFALKNMGWKDRTETELSGKDGGPIQVQGFNYLPPNVEQ